MAEDHRVHAGKDPDSRKRDLKHRIAAAEAVGDDKTAERLRSELKAVDEPAKQTDKSRSGDGQSRPDGRGTSSRA